MTTTTPRKSKKTRPVDRKKRKQWPFSISSSSSSSAPSVDHAPSDQRASNHGQLLGNDNDEVTLVPQAPAMTRRYPQCWALNRKGQRCPAICKSREGEPIPIPYCHQHLKSGDFALKVVNHKLAGKCLVARFDLPARYRIAFHGIRGRCAAANKEDRSISFYPPHPMTGSNYYPNTRTLRRHNYNGVLNPDGTGDLLQFAACPGPTERQNIRSTFRYWGKRNGHLGGLEFVTIEPIPKNTQLVHFYGQGWWSARELARCDIGTSKYPAPKRPAYVDKEEEKMLETS